MVINSSPQPHLGAGGDQTSAGGFDLTRCHCSAEGQRVGQTPETRELLGIIERAVKAKRTLTEQEQARIEVLTQSSDEARRTLADATKKLGGENHGSSSP